MLFRLTGRDDFLTLKILLRLSKLALYWNLVLEGDFEVLEGVRVQSPKRHDFWVFELSGLVKQFLSLNLIFLFDIFPKDCAEVFTKLRCLFLLVAQVFRCICDRTLFHVGPLEQFVLGLLGYLKFLGQWSNYGLAAFSY